MGGGRGTGVPRVGEQRSVENRGFSRSATLFCTSAITHNMSSTKKVLYFITKATWGGAQRYVYDLATHLPLDQFEPVVVYGTSGKLARDLDTAEVPTKHLPSLGRDIALISDIASFFQILTVLRETRPDTMHLNSSKAAALGALAGRIALVPRIVFTVHGWPFREKRNTLMKAGIWLASWMTALLSHRVICVSDHDLRQARHMPGVRKKAVRIYNGIDLQAQFGYGEKIRNAFPTGVKITGTIGELNTNKNQRQLIEQARKNPTMYVAIVGEGEERAHLESLIKQYDLTDRVKFFGFVPTSEVIRGFDTFALPSLKEGLPYVLIEAKAAGIPIVANHVGGVAEILDSDIREFSLDRMIKQTLAEY